ncbi:CKS-domain-containing protein [Mycena floridula]|nr:CKS-domain-containing protein [Mycena floridula]
MLENPADAAKKKVKKSSAGDMEQQDALKEEQRKQQWKDITDRILYSDRYTDDFFEYRHVTLPREIVHAIPKSYWNREYDTKVLRLLSEDEWRGIGVMQSPGWSHYEVHGASRALFQLDHCSSWFRTVPEPLILLFRRPKGYGAPQPEVAKDPTRRKK